MTRISSIALAALAIATTACRAAPAPPEPLALSFPVDTLRATAVREGVTHRFIYSASGPWAINVLEARADQCWSIAGLKSGDGAVGRATTSQLVREAARREEIAGGVNADFFLFTPPGVPVGLLIVDGRLIAGPIAQPALAADSSGTVSIASFRTSGHVLIDGRRLEIEGWNRDAPRGLAWFDRAWGAVTDTATGVLELVIEADAYRAWTLDTVSNGVSIPLNGGVLKVGREAHDSLRAALRSAQSANATVSVALTPRYPRDAVGGRPVLVRNGAIAARLDTVGRTGFSTSRHPRTAAGVTRDGRVLLVTVDGRQAPYSDGMTLQETAELMLSLGAREAVNLDGGGSTAMVVATADTAFAVVNRPSDRGGERAVGDAVGLVRRCSR